MADTTSTAGIRINADASSVAGAAKEGAEALGRLGDETKKLTGAGKDAREAAAAFTQRLKEQADTLGMSRIQIEQYKAAQLDLNTQQRASVRASLEQIEAHERLTQSTARGTSATLDFMMAMAGYDVIRSAASALVDYAKEATLLATRHETLGVVMTVVGRNAGYTAGEMAMHAEGVRKMGITMVQSRESVVKMAQANIDLGKATELARVAQDAAVIGNTNSSEALGRLIYGIQSAQTDVLRTIGINVNFENSYKTLAKEIGKTTEQLTESEKAQSRANTVLEAGTRIAGTYEAAMGTAGKQMSSLARYAEDLKVLRGEIFNEALVIAVSNYTDALKGSNTEARRLADNKAFKQWGREIIETFAFVGDSVRGGFDAIAGAIEATAIVTLKSLDAMAQATRFVPGAPLVNWVAGDPLGKISEFTDSFTGVARENLQTRLNRPQLRDSAAAFFAQRDKDEERARIAQIEADFWGPPPVKGGAADSGGDGGTQSKKISDYERLIKVINEKNAVQTVEESVGRKLIASEADALKVMTGLRDGTLKMTDAQKMEIAAALEGTITSEKANLARERYTRQTEQAAQAHARWRASEEQATVKLEMQNRKLAEHNQTIGLSSEQLRALTVTRAEEALAIAKQNEELAQLEITQDNDAEMMHRRTEAARKFLDLTREGVARQAWAEQTKRMTEANDRMRDNLERGLTDSIIRGFDKGKPFARNFLDSLETMFKSAILTPVIQPIMRPVAGAITGVVQGAIASLFPGTAGAAGNGLDLLSAGSSVSGMFGGPSIGSTVASLFAPNIAGYGGTAGTAAALGELGINTAAGGALGGLGAALPWVGGALAIGSVLGLFGGGGGPKPSEAWLQGGPGSYSIGIDNAAGGDPNMSQVRAFNALLQDATKFDQAALASLVGTRVGNGSPADTQTLIDLLTQQLAPAAQAAATAQANLTARTNEAAAAMKAATEATAGAVEAQMRAASAAASAARQIADNLRQAGVTIGDAAFQLRGGPLSTLSLGRMAASAYSNLSSVFAQAMTGNTDALARLPQAANDYLQAKQAVSGSREQYAPEFGRVLGMLEQARGVAAAKANAEEYMATLLELQGEALKDIKAQLSLPSPDSTYLIQQQNLLSTIGGLLTNQTGVILTGNATQDVIKAITDYNAQASASSLQGLLNRANVQNDALFAAAQAGENTVSLLQQLVSLQASQAAAAAVSKAQASSAGPATTSQSIEQVLSGYNQSNFNITAAAAALRGAGGAAGFTDAQIATAIPVFGDYHRSVYNSGFTDGSSIDAIVSAVIRDAKNLFPGHATGLDYVPFDNYAMRAHKGEAVIDAQSMSAFRKYGISAGGSDNSALVAEMRAMRAELAALRKANDKTATATRKTADLLVRVTRDGQSLLTEAV